MQVRGLKLARAKQSLVASVRTSCRCVDWNKTCGKCLISLCGFAPHAGAWIETFGFWDFCSQSIRTSCRCVDWNKFRYIELRCCCFAPHAGAWIETRQWTRQALILFRTSCRCVDWNIKDWLAVFKLWDSHLMQVRGLKHFEMVVFI